jgi:nucleolar protein 9
MPKELRKRGKRHKKSATEHHTAAREQELPSDQNLSSGPSWIVPRADSDSKQFNPEAPFGYVDPELKAYFRTVDDQLKEWQQNNWDDAEGDEDMDPNESAHFVFSFGGRANDLVCVDRRMFLMAALQEIAGKERELATDPDCAGGLERMTYSMDDFVRRVFMDSLTGS